MVTRASPLSSLRARRLRKKLLVAFAPPAEVPADHTDALSADMHPHKWDEYCTPAPRDPRLTEDSQFTTTTAASSSLYDDYYNVIPDHPDGLDSYHHHAKQGKPPMSTSQSRSRLRAPSWKSILRVAKSAVHAAAEGLLQLGASWGVAWTTADTRATRTRGYTAPDDYE